MRRSAAALSVISYGAFILLHGYRAFMYLFVTFDRAFSLNPDMCSQKLASVNSWTCVKADVWKRELLATVQFFSLALNRHEIVGQEPKVQAAKNGAKGGTFIFITWFLQSWCKSTTKVPFNDSFLYLFSILNELFFHDGVYTNFMENRGIFMMLLSNCFLGDSTLLIWPLVIMIHSCFHTLNL